jgi:hypothetical protein
MMEMRIILGTLIQNVDVNVLDGFQPDFLPELSLNPGLRGMQMRVRFRDGAPVLYARKQRKRAAGATAGFLQH